MWFLHYYYYYHNHDLLATACCLQLLLIITILLHAGSSKIRATLAGKDKRKASISADQPRKRLREELTNHDYYEGKLLTCENKSINMGWYFACISVNADQPC